mgnify:CR=1 FL=1
MSELYTLHSANARAFFTWFYFSYADELIKSMYKIDVLSKKTIEEKVLAHISILSEKRGSDTVDIGMTQEQFARYLCVNRSVLTKKLNQMRQAGIIRYKKTEFTIIRNGIDGESAD